MGPRLMSRGYSYSRKAGNGAAFGEVLRARRPVPLPRTRQNSCFVSRCGSLQGVRAYPVPPCTTVALATGAANSIVKEHSGSRRPRPILGARRCACSFGVTAQATPTSTQIPLANHLLVTTIGGPAGGVNGESITCALASETLQSPFNGLGSGGRLVCSTAGAGPGRYGVAGQTRHMPYFSALPCYPT